MPTPPSVTPDYLVIGGSLAYSSWAKLRGIISDYNYSDYVVDGAHSLTYNKGFMTTDGNGLIRTEWAWGSTFNMPNFEAFDYNLTDSKLNFASGYHATVAGTICNDDRDELVGQTVTMTITPLGVPTSYSLTITTDAFDNPPKYQEFSASSLLYPEINSIGYLTSL